MAFSVFQTETAILKEMTTDGYGQETVVTSFSVDIDPVLGYKRTFSTDGEEITGVQTIISPNVNIDVTKVYKLDYNGRTYQVERMIPFYSIGGNILEHVEVLLR